MEQPLPKPFTPIVPAPLQAAYDSFQFAPAVRVGEQVIVSGIIGFAPDMSLPDDFAAQVENAFSTLELVLSEAGAALSDVASLTTYHVGDLPAQMATFIAIKTARLGVPHPAWTAVGVASLAVPGAQIEIAATAFVPQARHD